MTKSLSPTRSLEREISRIEAAVEAYLTPSITYVGKESPLFLAVKSQFFWIERIDHFSAGTVSEAYIFNGKELTAEIVSSLPENTILIVVHDAPFSYDIELSDALRTTLSVTLPDPSVDEISDNLKILMLMQEAMYLLNESCPIISIDDEYRRGMSLLVESVTNAKNTAVTVEDRDHAESIIEFLFDGLPSSLAPVRLENNKLDIKSGERYHILLDPTKKNLQRLVEKINTKKNSAPILLMLNPKNSVENSYTDRTFVPVSLPPLNGRSDDLVLLSILSSQRASHYEKHITYLEERQIKELAEETKVESRFLKESESLIFGGAGAYLSEEQQRIIKKYNRLSLGDVIDKIEYGIMESLYKRFGNVDSVVNAVGMTRVTYFKRRQRYKTSQSFLNIK